MRGRILGWRLVTSGLAAAMTLATPAPVAGQWLLEARGGRLRAAHGAAPVTSGALALGLRHEHPTRGLQLSVGIPANGDEPLWGTLGGWSRLAVARRGLSVGLDLSGQGSLLRGRDGGFREVPGLLFPGQEPIPATESSMLSWQALPLLAFEHGRVRMQARVGIAQMHIAQGTARVERTMPLGDVQATFLLSDAVAIAPTLRRVREPDDRFTDYAGLTAVAASSLVRLSGSVGHWGGRGDLGVPWSVQAALWPQGRWQLSAGVRHDSYDPLTRHPPQTAWNLALGVQLGPRSPSARTLAPIAAAGRDGRTTIRLPASQLRGAPRIAGDFTGWTPVPMTRVGRDWVHAIALSAGVYQYAFVDAEGRWFVPAGMPGRRDDGMGGHVAVLVVP